MLSEITPTLMPAPLTPYCARTAAAPWVASPSGSLTGVAAAIACNVREPLSQGCATAGLAWPEDLPAPL